jgi:hypothetical protein
MLGSPAATSLAVLDIIRCTGCWPAAVPETHRMRGKLGPPPLRPRERSPGESWVLSRGGDRCPAPGLRGDVGEGLVRHQR